MNVAGGDERCGGDGPWELPRGWALAKLGDLGKWTGGGTPSKSNSGFWRGGSVPWVSPKDMKTDVIGETEDAITEEAVALSSAKYVPASSVLMVMRSGILRHTFPVAVTDRTVTLNQDLRALTPREGITAAYVAKYLKSASRLVLTDCAKDGTTVNSIEADALERLPIPIAPTNEQRRIVERIDALFAEIANGEAALAEARKGSRPLPPRAAESRRHRRIDEGLASRERASVETGVDLLKRIKEERLKRKPTKARTRRLSGETASGQGELASLPDRLGMDDAGRAHRDRRRSDGRSET